MSSSDEQRREGTCSALSSQLLAAHCLKELNNYQRGEPSTDTYGLELLHRATIQGDQEAWTWLQHCFSGVMRGWLHHHPSREAASRLESEENYVAQAFERFWQATTLTQQVEFRTLAAALQYLRASLNGAILDTLRAYSWPREVSLPQPGEAKVADKTDGSEVWEILKALFPNGREHRVAYLLFHCGLGPREIVRCCPQEFRDIGEIYRVRRNIMERLLRKTDQLALAVQSARAGVKEKSHVTFANWIQCCCESGAPCFSSSLYDTEGETST